MEQFFTADDANDGEKLPLFAPDGKATDHWLLIRGIDSDAYRLAHTRVLQNARKMKATDDEEEIAKRTNEGLFDLAVSLVGGWSFEQECTRQNVADFLRKAPQVIEPINEFAGNRTLFFVRKRNALLNTVKDSSSSKSARKGQASR
jgi:hypothetical protein